MNLNKKFKKINNQKGFSAILTLLILGVVLVISLSISALMVSEIKMVGAYDQSVTAYYAADAGIEDSLLNVKNTGSAKPGPNLSPPPIFTIDLPPTTQAYGTLKKDQSAEVDFPPGPNQATNITIKWRDANLPSTAAVEWTIITYQKDSAGVSLPGEPGCNIDKGFYDGTTYRPYYFTDKPSNCTTDYFNRDNTVMPFDINKGIVLSLKGGQYGYKLRLKCLACTLATCTAGDPIISYTITAGDGQVLSGQQTIGSTGESNSSDPVRRKITVDIKPNPTLNGIFDYVLYSEDPLSKPGS